MVEWFRHDINAHNDIKLKKLARDYGFEGLGAYWVVVEILYANGGSLPERDVRDELEFVDKDILNNLIEYRLVTLEDGMVSCHRVMEEIQYQDELRQKKSDAGRKGNDIRWAEHRKAIAEQSQCDNNASQSDRTASQIIAPDRTIQDNTRQNNPLSVSKETSSPLGEKTRFHKPTVEEIKAYCAERNNGINAQSFYDFYESKGWMIGKNHMKDWKAAVRTWERSRTENESGRKKMTTDPDARKQFVNSDGSINLLGGYR